MYNSLYAFDGWVRFKPNLTLYKDIKLLSPTFLSDVLNLSFFGKFLNQSELLGKIRKHLRSSHCCISCLYNPYPAAKLPSAKFLVCYKFQGTSKSFKVGENIVRM